ncbi:hypothetical protein [Spirosoma arcticum]
MTNNNELKVDEAARKGEAMEQEALAKADKLLVKTASLRHQVNKLKDELAERIALTKQKKQAAQKAGK